ncbi:MAG: molecular chaperone TorD family protein [Rhodospirillales bacterium]|nr:molecular chaperone TorD family protein [Rhodospirillales bacterium]MDH3909756.1 molecular chaperone TorD family protein [Rhodospirillales bacterium]MDH3918418.1 molecular chaperone TorD family protein [Rhodospirillales bacterium]MDH3965518.1 molecular chaperone TorD family protein [Rhodospirillales bacterium]
MTQVGGLGPGHRPDEAARTAMERSNVYGFLAAVYRSEPTAALLGRMKSPDFLDALGAAGVALEQDLLGLPEAELLEKLAVEYTRLFIGPGSHIPPYSSVHLGGEGASLWGASTAWVKRFIEAAGFEYRPDYHDLPDHVSVALEFMQEITAREACALDEPDADEAGRLLSIEEEFVREHLAAWLPGFCDNVVDQARLPFYGEMAKLTKAFVESELESTTPLS